MSKLLRPCAAILALVGLSGCGSSPMLHVGNAVFNLGQELPQNMRDRHLSATVAFDEVHASKYQRVARNALYVNGIVEGTPEYAMRVVRMNINFLDGNAIYSPGEYTFMTGAIVPDHLPQLKAGDLVELRQTGTWRTMENFVAKQEGNIVVRILCRRDAPDFMECAKTTPKTGKNYGVGPTGTPYPASVKDYGFSFTPWYDDQGSALRPLPPR